MSEVILKFYKNKTKTIINAKHIYYLISESVFIILFLNPYLLFYFRIRIYYLISESVIII